MNTPTEIKQYLLKNGPSSVLEISKSIGVTKADIRYQLRSLLASNEVSELSPALTFRGRGRPPSRFEFVSTPSTNNFELLLNLLIEQQLESQTPEQIAQSLFWKITNNDDDSTPALTRINNTIAFLKRIGVNASWSAGKNGPQIFIINNPYNNKDPQPYHLVVDLLIQYLVDHATRS